MARGLLTDDIDKSRCFVGVIRFLLRWAIFIKYTTSSSHATKAAVRISDVGVLLCGWVSYKPATRDTGCACGKLHLCLE